MKSAFTGAFFFARFPLPGSIAIASVSSNAVERLGMLRSGDGRAFEVVSAKLENAEGQVETKKLAEGKWQVKLMIQPSTIKPDAAIMIETSIISQGGVAIPLALH